MRKPYIEIFSDIHSEFQNNFKEQGFKIAEFFDKIVVWLIGLSTGAILLILSKINELTFVGVLTINVTLGILVGSIVAGILGRILYAIALYLGYSFMASFSIQLKRLGLPNKRRELTGKETKEDIYLLFQEDFNLDIPSILDSKKNFQEDTSMLLDENARKLYLNYTDVILESIQNGQENYKNIFLSTFGYKKDFFEKRGEKSNRTKGIFHRVLTYVSFALYILSALLFGSAICYLIVQYIRMKQ